MDTLPTEVVGHIIGFLDLRCQLRLSAVSVWWQAAVSDCLRRRRRLQLTEPSVEELATLLPRMPSLKVLRVGLGCFPSLTNTVFDADIVSENCSHLEELDLSRFRLDEDSLERLCRRCPRLCDVQLPQYCSSTLLELLLRRLPGLRVLRLNRTDVSAAALALLPAGLERLELNVCQLPGEPRQSAGRWPRLKDLYFAGPADGLGALLSGCQALRLLHIGSDDISMDIVSQNCPRLEKLDLRLSQLDTNSLERLCRRCPRLFDVIMPVGCTSDLLELLLRRLPGLRALNLDKADISAAAVALLPASLERLGLSECRLPVVPRPSADRWPRLTRLVLVDSLPGSSDGMAALVAGCPRLTNFSCAEDDQLDLLPAVHMRYLDLSGGILTEERLVRCFGRLRQLVSLNLEFATDVTDRVLDTLAGVGSLVYLELGDDSEPVQFSMEALHRLVVNSRSLRSVRLSLYDEIEGLERLVVGLDTSLDTDRDVTLAVPYYMLQKVAEWAKPAELSPLRLVSGHVMQ